MAKKGCLALGILFMSDLVVSASLNSISFGFFAVKKFVAFSEETTFLLPSVPYCFEIVQASYPYNDTSERVQYSTPGLFFVCKLTFGYLLMSFSENSFFLVLFLIQIQCRAHHLILRYPSI